MVQKDRMDHMADGKSKLIGFFEATVEESLERMIQVRPNSGQRMIFIWIRDFLELNIFPLQGPGQHHSLLEVNVVIQSSMHKHVRFVVFRDAVDKIHEAGCLVSFGVVLRGREAHVAFGVDRIVKSPVGN